MRRNESIDSTELMVAIGIALGILHVADQGIGPIAKPERSVRSDLWIDRAKMLIRGADEVVGLIVLLDSRPAVPSSVVVDL